MGPRSGCSPPVMGKQDRPQRLPERDRALEISPGHLDLPQGEPALHEPIAKPRGALQRLVAGVHLEGVHELPHSLELTRPNAGQHLSFSHFEAVAGLPEPLIARAIVLREPPLPLLAGVLSRVAAYLGNDSGISHLAAALGVRGVVLFGAGQLAWRPWAEHVEPLVVSLTAPEESDAGRVTAELASLLA